MYQHNIENRIPKLFDVQQFIEELNIHSQNKNKDYRDKAIMMNSYDIAHNCIREVVFKLLHYPLESYRDTWMPILLRAHLGNAVHDFIQSNYSGFTEQEVSMKVPSIKCSTRIDCLIGDNVLVEIKSCTYNDYYKIIKEKKPRDGDFYQSVLYKYLIENHLEEIQEQTNTRTKPPSLPKYNIDTIQIIYVAHDVISADAKSFSECISISKTVKQLLQSRQNHFHFITSINLDLSKINVSPYIEWIVSKIKRINECMNKQLIPPMSDPFILTKGCHFCLYKRLCNQYGSN